MAKNNKYLSTVIFCYSRVPSGKRGGAWRTKFLFWTHTQRITAKLRLVFISSLVLLLCKLLLYFILVTYNFEQVIVSRNHLS